MYFASKPGLEQGENYDFCRSAALLPIIHSLYSGKRMEVEDWKEESLKPVRTLWAEMAYMVAEWCQASVIRLSNIYTAVPAYFALETDSKKEYILGLDLMCGDIVTLGRILSVTVHDDRMDLVLANSMVTVFFPLNDDVSDLSRNIDRCNAKFKTKGLPPAPTTDELSPKMVELLTTTTFVYNINGRPMTARSISNILGCQIDDVPRLLEGRRKKDTLHKLSLTTHLSQGCSMSAAELMLYSDMHSRVRKAAYELGVPESSVRVPPVYKGKYREPYLLPDSGTLYTCEGVTRALRVWSYRLRCSEDALKATWHEGITEDTWFHMARFNDGKFTPKGAKFAYARWKERGEEI